MQGTRQLVAAAATVSVALVLAACGSSSSNTKASTASTPASSTAPTTSSTPTTASTPTTSSGHISKSVRVASPAFYGFAVQVANTSAPYLSPSQATFAAHCIQQRFQAAGFKTEGDVQKATQSQANSQKVRDILTTCFLKGRDH